MEVELWGCEVVMWHQPTCSGSEWQEAVFFHPTVTMTLCLPPDISLGPRRGQAVTHTIGQIEDHSGQTETLDVSTWTSAHIMAHCWIQQIYAAAICASFWKHTEKRGEETVVCVRYKHKSELVLTSVVLKAVVCTYSKTYIALMSFPVLSFPVWSSRTHHSGQTRDVFDWVLHLLLRHLDQHAAVVILQGKRLGAVSGHPWVLLDTYTHTQNVICTG